MKLKCSSIYSYRWGLSILLWAITLLGLLTAPSGAQITAAPNDTNTQINQDGNRIDIEGGQTSRDGQNLFHNFEQFNVDTDEIANFVTPAQIQNVLGRVSGGSASVIDGILQMQGSNANLYLINPAGIIFGANASLDLPGSFTATTSDQVMFGDNILSVFGSNNYGSLVGSPNAFTFSFTDPGRIVNAGDLSVVENQSLMLLGGQVINTGTLSAPGSGAIRLVGVPGESRVRLVQENALLSLELETIAPDELETIQTQTTEQMPGFSPLSLPELLTSSEVRHATGLIVEDDGTVRLTGSGISLPEESGVVAYTSSVSDERTLNSNLFVYYVFSNVPIFNFDPSNSIAPITTVLERWSLEGSGSTTFSSTISAPSLIDLRSLSGDGASFTSDGRSDITDSAGSQVMPDSAGRQAISDSAGSRFMYDGSESILHIYQDPLSEPVLELDEDLN